MAKSAIILSGVVLLACGLGGWFLRDDFRSEGAANLASANAPHSQVLPASRPTEKAFARKNAKPPSDKPSDLPPPPEALAKSLPPDAAKWIMDWQAHELSGRGATDDELHALHEMLLAEKVDSIALCGLFRTIDFLDGHDASQHIYRVVVDKATADLNARASREEASPLLAAMWPMHDIFNDMQAHDVDRELIESLRKWEVRGSPHSQMVSYMYGELLYEAGSYDEAVAVYEDLQKERAAATEPSEYINRPLDWDLALCLSGAGRYAEAAQHYAAASQDHGPYSKSAAMAVPIMLYRAGQKQDAIAKFKEVASTYQLTPTEIDNLAHQMQGNQ